MLGPHRPLPEKSPSAHNTYIIIGHPHYTVYIMSLQYIYICDSFQAADCATHGMEHVAIRWSRKHHVRVGRCVTCGRVVIVSSDLCGDGALQSTDQPVHIRDYLHICNDVYCGCPPLRYAQSTHSRTYVYCAPVKHTLFQTHIAVSPSKTVLLLDCSPYKASRGARVSWRKEQYEMR